MADQIFVIIAGNHGPYLYTHFAANLSMVDPKTAEQIYNIDYNMQWSTMFNRDNCSFFKCLPAPDGTFILLTNGKALIKISLNLGEYLEDIINKIAEVNKKELESRSNCLIS